jgi:hypothetical protein
MYLKYQNPVLSSGNLPSQKKRHSYLVVIRKLAELDSEGNSIFLKNAPKTVDKAQAHVPDLYDLPQ